MGDESDGLVALSSSEKDTLVEKHATCPFIGSAVAQGKLAVRKSADRPLASIEDVRQLGNSGGGDLGDLLVLFASGNHAFGRGDEGRLDKKVPDGLFSLEFPGSQGSHPGHSGILQGDPALPGSGRLSRADFARLADRAKGGLVKRSDVGRFIAENLHRDPKSKVFGKEVATLLAGDLLAFVETTGPALMNKLFGSDEDATTAHRDLEQKLTKLLGEDNLVGSAGEFGLLFALLANQPGAKQLDGEPAVSTQDLEAMFVHKHLPEGWETWKKSRIDWVRNTTGLLISAGKEYRALMGTSAAPAAMRIEERLPWRNVGLNQSSTPKLSFWPESIEHLREIVERAERDGTTVRAVGSAHSWSDVAKTDDYLVHTDRLKRVLPIDDYQLRDDLPIPREHLVRVECGLTVRELNQILDERSLALFNMGGFDGQAICGATSTSTHGSGIGFGPLCDFVRSMELVGNQGKVFRIEPSVASGRALTDAAAYASAHPDPGRHQLVQDDQWYGAAIVSMGCLGLIYSVVLEVRPAFLLKETRTATNWSELKESLKDGGIRRTATHYELVISPYSLGSQNRCLVTSRTETQTPGDRERAIFVRYRALLEISAWWLRFLARFWPRKIRYLLNTAINFLTDDDYTDKSFKVLNLGDANLIPVLSTELGVPVEDDRYLAAIDRVLEVAEELAREEHLYMTVPLGVRFVRATQALLSPMHERDTCMIEIVSLAGVKGHERIMERMERELQRFGARPHWAKLNHVTHERLLAMYGESYPRWRQVHDVLNAKGTFSGPFTRRIGLGQP